MPEGNIPPMHSYCENVPGIGKVNLTIELMDRDSREIPLAVRLVKEGHEGHGDGHDDKTPATVAVSQENESDEEDQSAHQMDEHEGHDMMGEHGGNDAQNDVSHDANEHGVVYMPPEKHNSGIIVVSATIEEKGQYAVLLEQQDDAGNANTVVRIPVSFGGGGHGGHGGGFGVMEILLLAAVAGGGAFYFIRRKKAHEAADKS